MACSCPSCYYLMQGQVSPTGAKWCGWMGGTPEPGNPKRCHFVSVGQGIPEGLVVARSLRVVRREDLAAENEAFKELTGDLRS